MERLNSPHSNSEKGLTPKDVLRFSPFDGTAELSDVFLEGLLVSKLLAAWQWPRFRTHLTMFDIACESVREVNSKTLADRYAFSRQDMI
jgi:hypothetical protein